MTYPELKVAIADWLNRSDLITSIPLFIQMAETELNRKVRTRNMESTQSLSTTSDTLSLPSDFLEPIEAYIVDQTGRRRPLQFVTPLQFQQHKNSHITTGIPAVALVQGSSLLLSPAPQTSFNGELLYYASIPALSDSNPTNWLIQKYPDLYLYTSLMHSAPFLHDDERLPIWSSKVSAVLTEIHSADEFSKYGSSNLAASPGLAW